MVLQGNISNFDSGSFQQALATFAEIPTNRIQILNVTGMTLIVVIFLIEDTTDTSELSATEAADILYNKISGQGPADVTIDSFQVVSVTVFTTPQGTTTTTKQIQITSSSDQLLTVIIALAAVIGFLLLVSIVCTALACRKIRIANSFSLEETFKRYQSDVVHGE